jgi:hypothetical protein
LRAIDFFSPFEHNASVFPRRSQRVRIAGTFFHFTLFELFNSTAESHTRINMDEMPSTPPQEVSAEAVSSLASDEISGTISHVLRPYTARASYFNNAYNFHISPMSVPARMAFLRSMPNSSTDIPRKLHSKCLFETLPNEVLLNTIRFLDIASLVKFAASNSGMRRLVLSMPLVQIVKSHAATSLALSRMLRAGTARHFSLHRFVDTTTASACMVCKDSATFAPWICLVLCHRVCVNCITVDRHTIRIPKSMAVECFGLSTEDVAKSAGTALAIFQPTFLRSDIVPQRGLESSKIMRYDNKFDIISLRLAITMSMEKHAAKGGSNHVKLLIEQYLQEHHPELNATGSWTAITNDCKVRGLHEAIRKKWQDRLPCQDWVLIAYVPHLCSTTPPLQFETGVLCEGCKRDVSYAQSFLARSAAKTAAEKAYIMSQYLDHFEYCETARSIFRGERLNMAQEKSLKDSMSTAVARFQLLSSSEEDELMSIVRAVQLNEHPSEVRSAVANALRQIQTVGNRHLQQRTSSTWQTARVSRRLVGARLRLERGRE